MDGTISTLYSLYSSNLNVSETIYTSNLNVNNTINTTYINANAYNTPSDSRIKYSVAPITNSLFKVNTINGYTYSLINEIQTPNKNTRYAGVLAQELEQVLPEAVSSTSSGLLSVNYNSIIPLLIESIKELHTKVSKLESIVHTQMNIINTLTNYKHDLMEMN